MSAPRSDRPEGPDEAPEAAGEAQDDATAAGCPLLPAIMTAETLPVTALVTLPVWRALAARLRREQDATDRAIADAIDAVTEAL